ncbi:hypothetical protein AGMMS49965_23970 [Bacteroidia bacterium]|nr:hypothetical protein AGMMS49965_23970 [Bacteroidia bacterium]
MRKTIYTIAAIFLYSTTISAQNKLDKATYDKLVDYVNCRYAIAYIEKQIASQSNRSENDETKSSYKGAFHKVTATPTEDTIFKINKTHSGKTATFEVYRDAYETVIECPDFLEGCEVQKIGSQSVETTEKGEAELEYNTWKITKKAKIKFI